MAECKITEEDKTECISVLQRIVSNVDKMNADIETLLKKFEDKNFSLKAGHPLLTLKIQLMISYMANMFNLMLSKVKGQSIKDSEDVWRMIEIRTTLEKLRPLEHKLKYEIERQTQLALTGGKLAPGDPLMLKPDPSNLFINQDDEDDDDGKIESSHKDADDNDDEEKDDDDDDDDDGGKPQVYRPPKLVPMFYDADESLNTKREKAMERAKKAAMKSTLMNELRNEFTDQPEEIMDGLGLARTRDKIKEKEKTEYEESYFTRMQMTRKERMAAKRMQSSSTIGSWNIGRFSDISVLAGGGGGGGGEDFKTSKKNKKRPKGRGNKKKMKRIKFH